MTKPVLIQNVKPSDFIKRKPDAKKVYNRGKYDRTTKSYSCSDWDDLSREIFIKRGKTVYVGFTF
jgi:hypothetical protein|tara:strand:- start:103 stop:297 length:195 start_codon:yes stop_codon:yes gene_type:complete